MVNKNHALISVAKIIKIMQINMGKNGAVKQFKNN